MLEQRTVPTVPVTHTRELGCVLNGGQEFRKGINGTALVKVADNLSYHALAFKNDIHILACTNVKGKTKSIRYLYHSLGTVLTCTEHKMQAASGFVYTAVKVKVAYDGIHPICLVTIVHILYRKLTV